MEEEEQNAVDVRLSPSGWLPGQGPGLWSWCSLQSRASAPRHRWHSGPHNPLRGVGACPVPVGC